MKTCLIPCFYDLHEVGSVSRLVKSIPKITETFQNLMLVVFPITVLFKSVPYYKCICESL